MSIGIRTEEDYIVCGKGGCTSWTPPKNIKTPDRFENALKREQRRNKKQCLKV